MADLRRTRSARPARLRLGEGDAPDLVGLGTGHWLLARRTRTTGELACYICHGPRRATLAQLAAVAGARWAIEECFQQAKQTCGLDDYQVRDYQAWYTHITLAKLAYAALTGVREQTKEAAAEPARA